MNCRDTQILLPDVIQGKETPDEMMLVSQHLLVCQTCQREAEALKELFSVMGNAQQEAPSASYWNSLLPNIHRRIEEKSNKVIPGWLTRYVLSAAAVCVLVIAIFKVHPGADNDAAEFRTLFSQMKDDELQQVAEREEVVAVAASSSAVSDEGQLEEDKEVLKNIIQPEDHTELYAQLENEYGVSAISDQEVEQLIPKLEHLSIID